PSPKCALAFAERDLWNNSGRRSFRLDARELYHLAPLLGFFGNVFAEVAGRALNHGATKLGKTRLNLGVGKACIDLAVKLLDSIDGRVLWRAHAHPSDRLVARRELSHGRDVRQLV